MIGICFIERCRCLLTVLAVTLTVTLTVTMTAIMQIESSHRGRKLLFATSIGTRKSGGAFVLFVLAFFSSFYVFIANGIFYKNLVGIYN